MSKSRTVTITNQIRVLRSGSPWFPAIVYGVMIAPALLLIVMNAFPAILWVVLSWGVQGAFGQFSWSGYQYDLKRTNSRKTLISYVMLPLILIAALFIIFNREELSFSITALASIGLGVIFMLLTKYLSPWVYKEPRSEHFPPAEQEPTTSQ